ncbi:hypothetical protein JCM11251_006592 [Rhodosporidiobolus azoricus]
MRSTSGTAAWSSHDGRGGLEGGSRCISGGLPAAYESMMGASSGPQTPQMAMSVAGNGPSAFAPWVEPAFQEPPHSHPAASPAPHALHRSPAVPQARPRTSFASHPMWETTLQNSAYWSDSTPSSSNSWSMTLGAHVGVHSSHPPPLPLPLPTNESLSLPVPPPPIRDCPSSCLPLPPPPPPPSSCHAYHAPAPPYTDGLATGSSTPWETATTSSSIWPVAGPSSGAVSYEHVPPPPAPSHSLIPPPSSGWLTAPDHPLPGIPVENSPNDLSPVPPVTANSNVGTHSNPRVRRSSRTAAWVAGSASPPKSGGAPSPKETTGGSSRSKGKAPTVAAPPVVEDENDFYPLPPNAEAANGKPKKPRRKRRKLGEPPRDLAQRKYVCELCVDQPKSFARPSALKIHMLTHTKEKPHICPICFRLFAIISNLKRHQKLHEDENSSLCTTKGGDAGVYPGEEYDEGSIGVGGSCGGG